MSDKPEFDYAAQPEHDRPLGTPESTKKTHLVCSAEGCDKSAVETLFLRDQVGHVHDCAADAATVREWCDVTDSKPIADGKCLASVCTGNDAIWLGQPAPLGGSNA